MRTYVRTPSRCGRPGAATWLAVLLAAVTVPTARAVAAVPTFNQDVAPLLYARCTGCHRRGQIGASLPLQSYAEARRHARAIAQQVRARQMPPWPADPAHSVTFRNDPRLSEAELQTLVRWAEGGVPEGAGPAPAPPAEAPEWLYPGGRRPDAILKLAPVPIPAHGEVPYIQQRVKVALPADQWVEALQVRPGNNEIVHHMGITEVFANDGANAVDLDALTRAATQLGLPADALINVQPAVPDPANDTYDMFGVYTPGTTFERYAGDSARLLKAGSNLYVNFNIHFTTNGVAQQNHSELALWFHPGAPKYPLFRAPAAVGTLIANGRQLLTDSPGTPAEGTHVAIPPIPPQMANYELVGITAYVQPAIFFQLQPHAHMRARSFRYVVVYPDGREQSVLSVPQYDFHWQLAYDLETPLRLPAGSKLVVTARYDNSPANPHLRDPGVDPARCGPDKQALFRRQNQSWDEMFSPLVQYANDAAAGTRVRLVQTLGCLVHRDSQWSLVQAVSATGTDSPSTSAAALRAHASEAPGTLRYRLIGVGAFRPQGLEGARVEVKGALIADAGEPRLNVTSLQKVAGSCP